jgi:hypothetical protein
MPCTVGSLATLTSGREGRMPNHAPAMGSPSVEASCVSWAPQVPRRQRNQSPCLAFTRYRSLPSLHFPARWRISCRCFTRLEGVRSASMNLAVKGCLCVIEVTCGATQFSRWVQVRLRERGFQSAGHCANHRVTFSTHRTTSISMINQISGRASFRACPAKTLGNSFQGETK